MSAQGPTTGPQPADAPQQAVIDRIVEGVAVLLVSIEEREVRVPADAVPEGAGEGSVVRVRPGDPPEILGVDETETARRREEAAGRLERLRAERATGRFDRPGDGVD